MNMLADYGMRIWQRAKAKQLKTFLENKRMVIKNDKTYRFNPEFYY